MYWTENTRAYLVNEGKKVLLLTAGRFINGKPSGTFWYNFHSFNSVLEWTKQGTITEGKAQYSWPPHWGSLFGK
jgi:hypothetical protein